MENVLEIKNLCKKYNGFELKNINLELQKGMIMGLIGENRSRKINNDKSYFKCNEYRWWRDKNIWIR